VLFIFLWISSYIRKMKRKKLNKTNRIFYNRLFIVFLNFIFVFITILDYGFKFEDLFYPLNSEYIVMDNNSIIKRYKKETSGFIRPVDGVITSPFSYRIHPIYKKKKMHSGIDIGAEWHDKIKAVSDGVVVEAGLDKYGYGNYIKIKHKYDIHSFYAHLSKVYVKEGDKVKKGDIIGREGGDPVRDKNPGSSTGHHLHFEIRTSYDVKDAINPLIFVDYK